MTRQKTHNRPAANPVSRSPRQSVGMTKAIAKFDQLQTGFNSHLSDGLAGRDMGTVFAQAFAFILRDDWVGSKLFDAPDLGRVLRLLFKSADIQASWKEIGYIEKSLDQLMPEMTGLVVRLIAFKSMIREEAAWRHFEELLPDRFLFAVFEAFNGDKPVPAFFANSAPYDWGNHRKTNYAGLLFAPGGHHG